MYQKIRKSPSSKPQTQQKSSQLASPSLNVQAKNSPKPTTQEEIEQEAFGQDKLEASRLQLKSEMGILAPAEQSKLGVLQAKMDDFWVQRREKASRFGHNIANIPLSSPHKQSSTIQTKMTMGEPGDKYEREADSIAEKFVQPIKSPQFQQQGQAVQGREKPEEELQAKSILQCSEATAGGEVSADFESKINRGRDGGKPLNSELIQKAESIMGMDATEVRTHDGSQANGLCRDMGARAFATGIDIFVGQGESSDDEKLMGHEIGHIGQQNPDLIQSKAIESNKRPSGDGVIQMAGHAGVMIFGKGKLFKRVETNEAQQFENVLEMQKQGNATGVFPEIFKVQSFNQLNEKDVKNEYGNEKEVIEWLKKWKEGDCGVEMENLGGPDVDVLDFKIGTATADQKELESNYNMKPDDAKKKVKKMGKIDTTTETASEGLRDSDAAKASIFDNLNRIVLKKFVPTLNNIKKLVQQDIEAGREAYDSRDRAIVDLKNIEDYISSANTVYIASSLVMKWNKDRKLRNQDRVVLIDLAHPIEKDMEGFEDAQKGMLDGIRSLKSILLNSTDE